MNGNRVEPGRQLSREQVERLTAERARRALFSYDRYTFAFTEDEEAVLVAGGETPYQVTPERCECVDHERYGPAGVLCKHRQMVEIWISSGETVPE